MADTKQDRAINAANAAMGLCHQLSALRAGINQYVTQFDSEGYAGIWLELETVPLNPDGSLGTNPDSPPNKDNPLNAPQYPALTRAVTPQDLENAVNMLLQMQNFFTNQDVLTANYNSIIDALTA